MMILSKTTKAFLFFILLTLFIISPVLGNTQDMTEVNVDHQITYDIFMDNETGTYSTNVTSFLTIYPTDTINFVNATVEVTIFKINSSGAYEDLHTIFYDNKTDISRNEIKLLANGFTVKNISYSFDPEVGQSIAIPHQTYMIVLNEDVNKTLLIANPTRVVISLPYDDYNYSELVYSSIPPQNVYAEGKRVTIVLNGIEEYTEYQRPFLLFFISKEDESKKALDNITMNSNELWILGIVIAVFIAFIFTYTLPKILEIHFILSILDSKEKIAFYTRLKGWMRDFMLFYVYKNEKINKEILDEKIQKINNNRHCMSKEISEVYSNMFKKIVIFKDYGPKSDNEEIKINEIYEVLEKKIDKEIKRIRTLSLIVHVVVILSFFIGIIYQINSLT